MRIWRLATMVAALATTPALAQQPPQDAPPPPMQAPSTRAEAVAAMRTQFARIDANGDGSISRAEFDAARAALRAGRGTPPTDGTPPPPRGGMGMGGMGLSGRWFDRVDADGDGKVTMVEAEHATTTLFDLVDTDHDGTISPDERRAAMAMMQAMRPHRGE